MICKAVIAVLIGLQAAPVAAQTRRPPMDDGTLSLFLLDQLRCREIPDPIPALAYLAWRKAIRFEDQETFDHASCWRLLRPIDVAGLPVAGICAAADGIPIQGTLSGPGLAIATAASPARVSVWVRKNRLAPSSVQMSYVVRDGIDLSCAGFDFGNHGELPYTHIPPVSPDRRLRHIPQTGRTEME